MGECQYLKRSTIVLVVIVILLTQAAPSFSKNKDAYVAGKVYDTDQKTPIMGIPVRLVNINSGESRETKTQQEGCYSFKGVPQGTYSISVRRDDQDYLLPDKIKVDLQEREVAVAVCVALASENKLALLDNCHICLGKGFPPFGIFLIAGGAAAATGIIIDTGGEDPVVSPSRP
jgi:hypothetical protein